jgi:hypothetical protein
MGKEESMASQTNLYALVDAVAKVDGAIDAALQLLDEQHSPNNRSVAEPVATALRFVAIDGHETAPVLHLKRAAEHLKAAEQCVHAFLGEMISAATNPTTPKLVRQTPTHAQDCGAADGEECT